MRLPSHHAGEIPPAVLVLAGVVVLILIIAGILLLLPKEEVLPDQIPAVNETENGKPETTNGGPEPSCKESDAGKNVFETGNITWDSESAADSCIDSTHVLEHYCTDRRPANESIMCPEGYFCTGGACIVKPVELPKCFDSDNGTYPLIAGYVLYGGNNYSDVCIIVNEVKEYYCQNDVMKHTNYMCDPGFECRNGSCIEMPAECSDSDEGKDKFKKGMVSVKKGYHIVSVENDYCVDKNNVREYFCSDSTVWSEIMECGEDHDCDEGTCVYQSCDDSDGGQNLLEKGTTSKGSVSETDICSGAYNVEEYYCTDNSIQSTTNTCPSGYWCSLGECVVEPGCSDSDGGKDYWASGIVTKGSDTYMDSCKGNVLTEYYCDGKIVRSEQSSCPELCDTDSTGGYCRVT